MSIFEIILGAFLVWAIIIRLRGNSHQNKIKISHPLIETNIVFYKVEKINNTFYLWNKDTDDFLAQGSTMEEAAKVLVERFPNTIFKGEDYESRRGQT